jgi:hypothetical protein
MGGSLSKQKTKSDREMRGRQGAAKAGGEVSPAPPCRIFAGKFPHPFSAHLTHGLKLDTVVWLLRCSVLKGTPMASAKNIQFQKAKRNWLSSVSKICEGRVGEENIARYARLSLLLTR